MINKHDLGGKMKSVRIDMGSDKLLSNIIKYAIPIILSGVLQLFFNAADVVVVGNYAGDKALAAVGSTTTLINLLVNLFIGLSIGASVVMGRYYGAKDLKNASDTLHTAISTAIIGGIFLLILGLFIAKPMLEIIATPSEIINLSTLYMQIYFCGMPAFMIYNFGAAILRATGDTKRPLYFLSLAGVFNVLLNLFFVISLNMSVAGVALATIISQYISAFLIILSFFKNDDFLKLHLNKLSIKLDKFIPMLKVGIPAGIQAMLFSISNLLIQSSVNSFGHITVAGNTAASNIEGFIYTSCNAVYQTCLSFTAYSMGAKRYDRITKIFLICSILSLLIGETLGISAYLFGSQLIAIYNQNSEVIKFGMHRLAIVASFYGICGLMDTMVGSIRAMGYSLLTMFVSIFGICIFRIFWIFTFFKSSGQIESLYMSYPISWIMTASFHLISFLIIRYYLLPKKTATN